METIKKDAYRLLEQILNFTGGVSGKATIWWSPKMRPAFPWRNSEPLTVGVFPYKYEATKAFLINQKVFISVKEKTVKNPLYLYGDDVEAFLVEIDADKVREFLNKPQLTNTTETWNEQTGVWIFKILGEIPIKIKLGKEGTATNKAFCIFYSMKNTDIDRSKFYKSEIKNAGRHITTLRKWIKNGLGKEHYNLASISLLNYQTNTYKLVINL